MNMKDELVSVVVPSYNAGRYLAETLQSVADQKYQHWEAIVVDDGSNDNTSAIAASFVEKDSRFRLFRQANSGVSAARNNGFHCSAGKYVAFLDADDVWLEDNLSAKVDLLQRSSYGLVHSDATTIDSESLPSGRTMNGAEGNLLNFMLLWSGSAVPGPSSILLRREVLQKVGLFDTRLSTSADHDFFLRVAKNFSIGRVPQVTWRYRLHGANMHKNIALMEHDVLIVYENAVDKGLFKSAWFEQKCFANMYLILAANWIGEVRNYRKGTKYIVAALLKHPAAITNIFNRLSSKWKAG
jgi:glycosyltransferase involved in cell wall biosynthesis